MFDMMPFGRHDRNLFQVLDNFEKSFFNGLDMDVSQFRTDILDKGDRYRLEAELPGFRKEDIRIGLNGDTLTIRAEHREDKEEQDDKKQYVRRERKFGSFSRSFDVSGVRTGEIAASYENGVLRLELPKSQPEPVPASRQIEIR